MSPRLTILFLALGASSVSHAQTQKTPPQTARLALIEMFTNDGPEAFARHLPEAARKIVRFNGLEPYSFPVFRVATLGRQMVLRGEHVETFESGPNILVNTGEDGYQTEVTVERDSQSGENEEIELSAHVYHDGQEQFMSVIPRLVFVLRQEKEIWRLVEVTAAARIPLTDPNYLHGFLKRQQESNESAAQMRVINISNAEAGYTDKHPERGYTCSLSTLFAPEPEDDSAGDNDDNTEAPRNYYDPGQGSTEWNGYRFALTDCDGSPASKYRVTAVPADSDAGVKVFCADESGLVKSSTDGTISACFSDGEVLNPPSDSAVEMHE